MKGNYRLFSCYEQRNNVCWIDLMCKLQEESYG